VYVVVCGLATAAEGDKAHKGVVGLGPQAMGTWVALLVGIIAWQAASVSADSTCPGGFYPYQDASGMGAGRRGCSLLEGQSGAPPGFQSHFR
jgi:hypothetical protein